MLRRARNRAVMAVIATLVGIMITLIVYTALGINVNTSAVRIYDEFSNKFFCNPSLDHEERLTCNIKNSASMSLPYINPFYGVTVTIIDSENNAFVYFMGSGNKKRNFTDYYLDLGKIDSGDSNSFSFYLYPNEGNVTFQIEVFLVFVNHRFAAASKAYLVEYHGDYRYTLSETTLD